MKLSRRHLMCMNIVQLLAQLHRPAHVEQQTEKQTGIAGHLQLVRNQKHVPIAVQQAVWLQDITFPTASARCAVKLIQTILVKQWSGFQQKAAQNIIGTQVAVIWIILHKLQNLKLNLVDLARVKNVIKIERLDHAVKPFAISSQFSDKSPHTPHYLIFFLQYKIHHSEKYLH